MKRTCILAAALGLQACSLLPSEPAKATYDFGLPREVSMRTTSSPVAAPVVVVAEVTSPTWMDRAAMHYRLAYRDAANPIPYSRSEWVMPPAGLGPASGGGVRAVLTRDPDALVLRSELQQFEQVFDAPKQSRGVIRMTATLAGRGVSAQRSFAIERPAATPDARGGVGALSQGVDELVVELREWIASASSGREAPVRAASAPGER